MSRKTVPVIIIIIVSIGLIYLLFFNPKPEFKIYQLVNYVNPLIGTDAHGHTFPGATMPFGMVQLSPDTRLSGWDGCSAYHYSDSVIYGFSHTHLSGTGCSDYGDILLMPMCGKYSLLNDTGVLFNANKDFLFPYSSKFSHNNELSSPGFYSVHLNEPDVDVSLTVTERTGMHKYDFNSSGQRYIILDLEHRDVVLDAWIQQLSPTRLVGMRKSKAWAEEQYVFFAIDFNTEISVVEDWSDPQKSDYDSKKYCGDNLVLALRAEKRDIDEILVKVALSPVSVEGAIKNMEKENPGWDFNKIKDNAAEAWNKELSRIIVKGSSDDDIKTFYTALYHTMIHPNIYQDVDGKYRGTDLHIHDSEQFTNYTVFSLWDTYRATHPLFTIIQQKRTLDFIKTFLDMYQKGGKLPMWELASNYTGCMIGYHSVPPIVDAYLKGIRDFDTDLALEAMILTAETDELGKKDYIKYGFIPIESEHESVSKTLEYAFDDWCIAQFAKTLDQKDIYKTYLIRSQAYKHLLDQGTGFMRPRYNNAWKKPFDPKEVDFNFTEANSWQYSFYVPHDIKGFINMIGGNTSFEQKLDSLFNVSSETYGKDLKDISGMIGQYAHGNEPSHHITYMYNYINKPWKTQELVRKIMTELYLNTPDGLCGNEDCGQMSAWYIFSALGFYPINPANGIYDIGSPLFDTAMIQLENGKMFTIISYNNSQENIYVQNLKLNGKDYNKTYIKHSDILNGSTLEFFMGASPNKSFGTSDESVYNSIVAKYQVTPAPYVNQASKTFHDSIWVNINCSDKNADIFYNLNDESDKQDFKSFNDSILITETTELYAYAISTKKYPSNIVKSEFLKIEGNRKINLFSKFSSMYTAGGPDALIDMLRGNNDFRNGHWQGYRAQDFEAIIDLGELKTIKSIETGFIQDVRSWILMPKFVEYYYSKDGIKFTKAIKIENDIPDTETKSVIKNFTYSAETIKARYVKVFAPYYGKLPEWHLGAGYESWLFLDEIKIETE
jgi:predicted alpha-1,2-mannosidase